jgi:hypothetical protein
MSPAASEARVRSRSGTAGLSRRESDRLRFVADLDSSPKSVQSLYAWYAEGKLWVNRRYQRKLVWTLEEKQKLVESVLRRYPIPAILLAEREGGDYEVIDGLQRLHTLMSFIETSFPTENRRIFDVAQFPTANTRVTDGAFAISTDYPEELTAREVGTYLDYAMAISIMRGATDAEIDEVFSRINTYGHRLSDQERRQAGVRNGFSQLVRDLSSAIRGDVSADTLTLADMPSISIDLPMARHGYEVAANEVFWVSQGILRSTDLRDSMDEQCIADIAASIVGGAILARSKDALDEIYREGSNESERIDVALASYGADKFSSEFKYVIDEIRSICEHENATKLRSLLFSKQTTNPFPAVFAVLAIAMHELLVGGVMQIGDYAGVGKSLTALDKRIDTSRGSTSPEERQRNIDTIKGLIRPHLVPAGERSLYDNQTATDIDDAIRRSEIEAPHYELKQGLLRLDEDKALDPDILDKIVRTVCAIANNGNGRSGALLVGIADSEADSKRIAELYGIQPRKVGRKHVVGVRREVDALGEKMEDYFSRIRSALADSELSQPLKGAVLASLTFTEYFGLGVVVVNVPPQEGPSTVGARVFVRQGDQTVELDGADILQVAARFQ